MEELAQKIRKKTDVYYPKIFIFLVFLFWIKDTVLSFVVEAISRILFIGEIAQFIIPSLFLFSILLSLPFILRNILARDLIYACIFVLIVLISGVFFPQNLIYIEDKLWNILGLSLPLYFVGICFRHQSMKKTLYYASIVSVIVMFSYQIYILNTGRELHSDNMNAAYNVLPSVMYLLYYSFEKNKLIGWIFAVIGFILLFIFGTRGPILACVIFVFVSIILKFLSIKNILIKGLIVLVGLFVIWFLFSGDNLLNIAKILATKFEEIGFSTRVFDFYIQGNLNYNSGRDVLQEKIWNAIQENPFGYGCMGDRPIINTYVHNIVLEMLCSYGIIGGTVALLGLIVLILTALTKAKGTDEFRPLLMFVTMVLTKLMLSGSYIVEPYFFLLIGLCVRIIRKNKKRGYQYENCTNQYAYKWQHGKDNASNC